MTNRVSSQPAIPRARLEPGRKHLVGLVDLGILAVGPERLLGRARVGAPSPPAECLLHPYKHDRLLVRFPGKLAGSSKVQQRHTCLCSQRSLLGKRCNVGEVLETVLSPYARIRGSCVLMLGRDTRRL